MYTVLWKDPDNLNTAILTKSNNEIMTLSVGDFITYPGRPDGVKVTYFTYKDSDTRGPIGMCYIPWRPREKRWASEAWSLKGNTRHITAFPVGSEHYGEQVNWDTIEFLNEGIPPVELPKLPPSPPPSD